MAGKKKSEKKEAMAGPSEKSLKALAKDMVKTLGLQVEDEDGDMIEDPMASYKGEELLEAVQENAKEIKKSELKNRELDT